MIKGKYNDKWAAVEIVLQDTDNKVKNSIMNLDLPWIKVLQVKSDVMIIIN